MPASPGGKFDIICANLISDLLIAQRRKLAGWLKPGGTLIIAGILREEFPSVAAKFELCGLRCIRKRAVRE